MFSVGITKTLISIIWGLGVGAQVEGEPHFWRTSSVFSQVSVPASSRQLLKSSCVDASFSFNFLHLCQVGTRGSKPAWEPRKNRASKTNSLYFLLKHGETSCSNYCWIQQKQMKGLRHPEKPTGEPRHTF